MTLDAFFQDTDTLDFGEEGAKDDARGTLLEVLDRLLDRGVVVVGDLKISVADVDLLFVGVKLFVSSIDTIEDAREKMAERAHRALDCALEARASRYGAAGSSEEVW